MTDVYRVKRDERRALGAALRQGSREVDREAAGGRTGRAVSDQRSNP